MSDRMFRQNITAKKKLTKKSAFRHWKCCLLPDFRIVFLFIFLLLVLFTLQSYTIKCRKDVLRHNNDVIKIRQLQKMRSDKVRCVYAPTLFFCRHILRKTLQCEANFMPVNLTLITRMRPLFCSLRSLAILK